MSVKTAISEEEYLHTSFPGLDQEYRDGEVVERTMPDFLHGSTQSNVCTFFGRIRKEKGAPVFTGSEVRNRVRAGRHLIPDVCVFWPEKPTEPVPEIKPHIVVEILSPWDTMIDVLAKLREYVEWGVPHVWLIDPRSRILYLYDTRGLREVASLPVPEAGIEMLPADVFD